MTLEVRGLAAGYGRKPVVSGVSATVASAGWLSILGPNGSGKSTLLKAICGLLRAEGEVLLHGRQLARLRPRTHAQMLAYAPQIPSLPSGLTVTDYVLLGRTPYLSPLGRESHNDRRVVTDVLARLGLVRLAERPLATLSGGERQRTVLARALAQRAEVLLLDEPTTGLDIGHAQELLDLIDELRTELGTTVVMTLHDLTMAAQYAEQLLLLDQGHMVARGTPKDVLTTSMIAERYSARVTVSTAEDGSLVIAPWRGRPETG